MFLNYVNSDDSFGQINVNRLIYRTSTLLCVGGHATNGLDWAEHGKSCSL